MTMEIRAIGGYGVVGRNMTAVRVRDNVVLFDMGLHLPNYIKLTEENEEVKASLTRKQLLAHKVVPDDRLIEDWRKNVVAIVPTHAHLDHIGAIPYLAKRYNAPIIATPFTAEVLKTILKDERMKLPNEIKVLSPNSKIDLGDGMTLQFVAITHSIPHAVMIYLKTSQGNIVYMNDFKLDNHPTLGRKPDMKRIDALGDEGIDVAIIDSLYAHNASKTPSEGVAKDMLADVLLHTDLRQKGIIVTTFASHIARLKSIVDMGKKLNRNICFLGRSLAKYSYAAENAGLVHFSDDVIIARYAKRARQLLNKAEREGKHKYMFVVTGHQGEPKSVLARIARGEYKYALGPKDYVVFSSNVIPTPITQQNRIELEEQLKARSVRIFRDVHVSGHGSREDIREMLTRLKPKHIIPSHSTSNHIHDAVELAEEEGYHNGSTVHGLFEGQRLHLS